MVITVLCGKHIKNKSRQAATFEMGLGSSVLEKVVIPYTNSPSTNPSTKVMLFLKSARIIKKYSPT